MKKRLEKRCWHGVWLGLAYQPIPVPQVGGVNVQEVISDREVGTRYQPFRFMVKASVVPIRFRRIFISFVLPQSLMFSSVTTMPISSVFLISPPFDFASPTDCILLKQ